MKVQGTATLTAPAEKAWEAILDPKVLVSTIPGCERLEATGENQYSATVSAGVAAIKGTYTGKIRLSDLQEPKSLLLHAEGASAAGTVSVDVRVTLEDLGDGTTQIDYDADAVVGGMIGGVGQRMLISVSKRISGEFFGNINKVLTGERKLTDTSPVGGTAEPSEDGQAPAPTAHTIYGTPARPAAAPADGQDLFKGLVAGAVITLIGVVVGAIAARRR